MNTLFLLITAMCINPDYQNRVIIGMAHYVDGCTAQVEKTFKTMKECQKEAVKIDSSDEDIDYKKGTLKKTTFSKPKICLSSSPVFKIEAEYSIKRVE